MSRLYIGIDNGVSGSIGLIKQSKDTRNYAFFKTPTFSEQDYVKNKRNITRIDFRKFIDIITSFCSGVKPEELQIMIERPMINPGRFRATISATRAMEATLIGISIVSEGIPIQWVDSKEWQKILLPKKLKGDDLKKASLQVGLRMFPKCKSRILRHKDADGLLIAEHCRRSYK